MRFTISTDGWQLWSLSALGLLILMALVTDVRERRIPNALIIAMLCVGIVAHLIGPEAWKRSAGLFSIYPGALGLKGAVLGALTGLALFLPFYLLRLMGAGDVKLMAGVGSFAGPAATADIALFVLLAGGALAIARILAMSQSRLVMRNMLRALGHFLPGSAGTFEAATQTAWRMPYAVAIAAGLLAYGGWIYTDHLPLVRF